MSARSRNRRRKRRRLIGVIAMRDGMSCRWCGEPLALEAVTIEHVIPRSRGGGNTTPNLALACAPCNSSRPNPPDWPILSAALARLAEGEPQP